MKGSRVSCALSLILLIPTLATGAPRSGSSIAMLTVGLDSIGQAKAPELEAFSQRALWRSGRFEPVDMVDALDRPGASARALKEREADDALKAGLQDYNDLDTQRAAFELDKAMKAYEQDDLSKHFDAYLRAWLMRIASQVANGESKAAAREIDRLVAVAPRTEFPPSYFPPDLIARAERARKAAAASTFKMRVETLPVPAEIYVDGQFRGYSPISLTGLPAGEHWVSARATGYVPLQVRGREAALSLTLKPAAGLTAYLTAVRRVFQAPKGRDRDAAAIDLGRFLRVDQVLVAELQKSVAGERLDATLVRIATSDGHNLGYGIGELQLGDQLAPQWDALIDPVLLKDVPRGDGPVTHYERPGGWTQRTTGYTLLGAGAALIAGGIFCGVQALQKNQAYESTPQTDPSRAQLRSDGHTFALLSDIFVIAGVASAGAGTWFGFFAQDKASTKGGELPMPPPPTPVAPPKTPEAPPPPPREDVTRARREEAERKQREEQERHARDAQQQRDRETQEQRTRDERDRARIEQERRAQDDQRRAHEEESRRAREAQERRARDDQNRKGSEQERKTREEQERKTREEQERKTREEQERKTREEQERKTREEQERKAREEQERKAREEQERKAREEQERKAREEQERKAREEQKKMQDDQKKKSDEDDLRNF